MCSNVLASNGLSLYLMTSKSANIYQPVWVSIGTGGYIAQKSLYKEGYIYNWKVCTKKNARVLGTKFPREGGILLREGGILAHRLGPGSPDQVAKEQRNRWMELTIGKR